MHMLPEGKGICQHTRTHTHRGHTLQGERAQRTSIELDEVGDLARVQVNADGVVDLDEWVWVADGAGVVGDQVGDTFGADDDLLYLAQLVLQAKEDRRRSKPTHSQPSRLEKRLRRPGTNASARALTLASSAVMRCTVKRPFTS